MKPSAGRIVHYTLNSDDVAAIGQSPAAGTHNAVHVGDIYPAMIVRVWGPDDDSAVNLQVFLDGTGTYWATSRVQGDGEYQWHEPKKV